MEDKICPKCGAERVTGAPDCPQCGVIYAKMEAKKEDNPNLAECPACHKQVSKNAKTCPHCGEPFKQSAPQAAAVKEEPGKVSLGWKISGLVMAAFSIAIFIIIPAHFKKLEKKSQEILSPAEEAQQEIDKCFGGWDGAHIKLKEAVKASMNDPDSFKAGETRYIDKIDHLIVIMDFSGKNAFGGIVKNSITAKTDKHTCEVLEIVNPPR